MMKRTAGMVALSLVLVCQPAWATRTSVHEAAESAEYGRKFGGMIGRGALNAVTFFLDPVVNIVNETKNGPPLVGTLTGIAKGLGCGVLRLGSAAVDLTTFWVPGFNGVPVSDSYDNCLAVGGAMASDDMPAPTTHASSGWESSAGSADAIGASGQAEPPAPTRWKK